MQGHAATAHTENVESPESDLVQLLGHAPEKAFNDLAALAALICGSSMSLVTLLGERWQYHKGIYGLEKERIPVGYSFCRHTVRQSGVLAVADAKLDCRFADNPLVKEDPGIRAYAGARISAPSGHPVGALCVIDTVPRELSRRQSQALQQLAQQATALIELRVRKQQFSHLTDALSSLVAKAKDNCRTWSECS